MRNRFPDHPFTRESWECPICGSTKRAGLVACDECFLGIWGDGTADQRAEAEEQLDAAEQQHVQDNGINGMGV